MGNDGGRDARVQLAELRAKIEEVDRRLVAILAERVELGQRAAVVKRAGGIPVVDPPQENEVVRRAGVAAARHALSPDGVREVFSAVVELSRRAQLNGE